MVLLGLGDVGDAGQDAVAGDRDAAGGVVDDAVSPLVLPTEPSAWRQAPCSTGRALLLLAPAGGCKVRGDATIVCWHRPGSA